MSKKSWILIIKACIGIWVLAVLMHKLNPDAILDALSSPERPYALICAALLLLPNLWIQWYRWHSLLNDTGVPTTKARGWESLLGAMPLGFITPGRVGEAGRALFLSKVSRWEVIAMVLIDKLYAFGPILVGGGWGIGFVMAYKLGYDPFLTVPLIGIGLLVTVLAWLVAVHPEWIRSVLYQISLLFPHRAKLKVVVDAVGRLDLQSARRLGRASILLYTIYIAQFILLVYAFETVSWYHALAAATATMLAKTMLPISFADLGVREGAAIYFFGYFGASKVAAFNGALLLFTLNVLIPALIGLIFLPRLGYLQKKSFD